MKPKYKFRRFVQLYDFLLTDQNEEFSGFIFLSCIQPKNEFNIPFFDSESKAIFCFNSFFDDIEAHTQLLIEKEEYELCQMLKETRELLHDCRKYVIAYIRIRDFQNNPKK